MLTHSVHMQIRILALLALGYPALTSAQLYEELDPLRGSGQLQTCDTSMHVSFATTYLNNYGCAFEEEIVAGSTVVQDMTWYYLQGSTWYDAPSIPTLYYPSQQPYPVCLNVNAYDMVAAQPCSTTVCKLITPLPEPVCASLIADFTIADIEGSTITFQDLTTFDGTVGATYWSFGDGAMVSSANVNTFTGAGPFEVCLTVVGAPPSECVSSVCKWLYLGPGSVECPVLVEQAYLVFPYENLVGVWDTSRTSGMYSRVDWDFGDGAEASGVIAVHAYAEPGDYALCGTLSVWGPLLSDTCVTTICHTLAITQTGLEEPTRTAGNWAYPSPFNDVLYIRHSEGFLAELRVLDPTGRSVYSRTLPASGETAVVDLSALIPGFYTVQLHDASGARTTRIVKH
jgi:PKD repeat protein